MKYHRVMTGVIEDDFEPGQGLPTVKIPRVVGAHHVEHERDEHYTAYGPVVKGVNTLWTHPPLAYLIRYEAGVYLTFSDDAAVLAGGKTLKQHGRANHPYWKCTGTVPTADLGNYPSGKMPVVFVAKMGAVPNDDATVGKPWTVGNATITSSVHSIPAERGDVRMAEMIEAEEIKVAVGP